jgi:hypothetical protein
MDAAREVSECGGERAPSVGHGDGENEKVAGEVRPHSLP